MRRAARRGRVSVRDEGVSGRLTRLDLQDRDDLGVWNLPLRGQRVEISQREIGDPYEPGDDSFRCSCCKGVWLAPALCRSVWQKDHVPRRTPSRQARSREDNYRNDYDSTKSWVKKVTVR